MYDTMVENMTGEQAAAFRERYGDLKTWKEKSIENASTEAAQQNFQKIVEWYGSKEKSTECSQSTNECREHFRKSEATG